MQVEVTKIDESSEVKVDAEEDELVDPLQESLVSKVDVKDEPSDLMCVSLDPDCQPLPAPHHLPHTSLKVCVCVCVCVCVSVCVLWYTGREVQSSGPVSISIFVQFFLLLMYILCHYHLFLPSVHFKYL